MAQFRPETNIERRLKHDAGKSGADYARGRYHPGRIGLGTMVKEGHRGLHSEAALEIRLYNLGEI